MKFFLKANLLVPFVFSFFLIDIYGASSSSSAPFNEVGSLEQVKEGFYRMQVAPDLWFIIEKVDNLHKLEEWENFIQDELQAGESFQDKRIDFPHLFSSTDLKEEFDSFKREKRYWGLSLPNGEAYYEFNKKWEEVAKSTGGRGMFAIIINLAKRMWTKNPSIHPFDCYVAYALSTTDAPTQSYAFGDPIEMVVTVSTTPESPFSAHAGIFRSIRYLMNHRHRQFRGDHAHDSSPLNFALHSNISISLHTFAARAIKEIYHPTKTYMINSPMATMGRILISAIGQDYVWIGDNLLSEEFARASNKIKMINTIYPAQEKSRSRGAPDRVIAAIIKKGSPITRTRDQFGDPNFQWSLKDPEGDTILHLNPEAALKYEWFFKGAASYVRSPEEPDQYLVADFKELSSMEIEPATSR